MAKALPPLEASPRQRSLINKRLKQGHLSHRLHQRYELLHGMLEGKSAFSSAKDLGLRADVGVRWYTRWADNQGRLEALEVDCDGKPISDHELGKQMDLVLSDRARSGVKPRITQAQKEQIVALACKKPSDYGLPQGAWTRDTLAQVAMEQKIVDKISPSHVRNILKKSGGTPA